MDLAADVDKLNQSPNQNAISAPTSVIYSSPTAPLAGSDTLHCHSKRALEGDLCKICYRPVQPVEKSTFFDCADLFHHGCVDRDVLPRQKDCPICHAKLCTSPLRPQSSSTSHQQSTEGNVKLPTLAGHFDPYRFGYNPEDYPDSCYSYRKS
ncbi:hypothetical protein PGTUg99_025169 [Puccinia graminis f. sp. tritici]|uniref:RING-type domain-containing protein n=1 Tax=Puccinia graminis f. sp. tritici TaxID=56615 RepID=A0A5B0S7H8_PUCGR|nr:hypothetical protein PGTUg99_025169 [Puccinia graminis f. sp. tritici]